MKTNLQALRKKAGFKSAREFADYMGMNINTYTDYEQGRRMFSLGKAWDFADALHCTLDELAGRKVPIAPVDVPLQRLVDAYKHCTVRQQASLIETAECFADEGSLKNRGYVESMSVGG